MTTHASRNTITGLTFEKQAQINRQDGINISKKKLKKWCKQNFNIDIANYLGWSWEPDEAYYLPNSKEVVIYEKKFQQTPGTADEKIPNCEWKVNNYKKLFSDCGINKVSYIYILCDWFKQPRYKTMLDYIESKDDCYYYFWNNDNLKN